jgi:hypothetical protein
MSDHALPGDTKHPVGNQNAAPGHLEGKAGQIKAIQQVGEFLGANNA